MKRFILTLFFVMAFVLLIRPVGALPSRFLQVQHPKIHEIQGGAWLSKIAERYYGDASYWKELALVNRTPDGHLIYPGERMIVPSFRVIQQIRHGGKFSQIKDLVHEQEIILAGNRGAKENFQSGGKNGATALRKAERITTVNLPEIPFDAGFTIVEYERNRDYVFLTGLVALGLLLAFGLYFYFQKRRNGDIADYGDGREEDEEHEITASDDWDDLGIENFREDRVSGAVEFI